MNISYNRKFELAPFAILILAAITAPPFFIFDRGPIGSLYVVFLLCIILVFVYLDIREHQKKEVRNERLRKEAKPTTVKISNLTNGRLFLYIETDIVVKNKKISFFDRILKSKLKTKLKVGCEIDLYYNPKDYREFCYDTERTDN